MISLETIKILLAFPFFIFTFFISSFLTKNYNEKISINFLYFLILLTTFVEFYFAGIHNSIEWLTVLEIPIILRDFDNNLLNGDLYTDLSYFSPKIIFAKIIHFLSIIFFLNIENTLYLLKLILIIINPLIIFKILTSFSSKNNYYLFNNSPIIQAISASFALGFLEFLQYYSSLGWESFSQWDFINHMSLANTIGLIAIHIFQLRGLRSLLGLIILSLATLIHPLSGIINFVVIFLLLNKNFNAIKDLKYLLNLQKIKIFFFSIFLPCILLTYIFKTESGISDTELIHIYAYERHPHHYLVSSFFNLSSIIWLILPLFLIIISLIENIKKLFIYSSIFFIFFPACILLQYYFTEINPVSYLIVTIGPTRFITHSLFIYTILFCIYLNKYKVKSFNINKSTNIIITFNKFKNSIFILIMLIALLFLFIIKKPILYKDQYSNEILNFFTFNSNPNSIIFSDKKSEWLLSFIRVNPMRRIFSDNAFIFNESAIPKWNKRRKIADEIRKKINNNDLKSLCNMKKLNINYFIFDNSNNLRSYNNNIIVFRNNIYSVIDIDSDNIKC